MCVCMCVCLCKYKCVSLCVYVYNGISAIMRGNNPLVLCIQSYQFSFSQKFWLAWNLLRPVGIIPLRTRMKACFSIFFNTKLYLFLECYSSKVENNSTGGRINQSHLYPNRPNSLYTNWKCKVDLFFAFIWLIQREHHSQYL